MSSGLSYEVGRTVAYLEDPANYGGFEVVGNRIGLGCIDRRDEEAERLRIMMQIAGGGAGMGLNRAMADRIVHPEDGAVTIEEGIVRERADHPELLLGAHEECRFARGAATVMQEMMHPSDRTLTGVQQRAARLGLEAVVSTQALRRIRDTAGWMLEAGVADEARMLEAVRHAYPDEPSITTMTGQAIPGAWVTNYSHLGLNRHPLHRELRLPVSAYHESIGAITANRLAHRGDPFVKAAWLGAYLLSAAAVETVLTEGHDNIVRLQVVMGQDGLQTSEVAA